MPAHNPTAVRKIFLIATEESGDRLGAALMKVVRQRLGDAVKFSGVGGRAMTREGIDPLFPIEELSIMGLTAVVKQLPMILRRIRRDIRLTGWLRLWLYVHVPLTIALIAALSAHILVTFVYW